MKIWFWIELLFELNNNKLFIYEEKSNFLKATKMRISPLLRVYWATPKGPKAPLYRPFKYFNMATPEKYGGSLFKNMLAEAPELFVSGILASLAFGFCFYSMYVDEKYGIHAHIPYKQDLVVIRPDDPMIETVKARRAYYENPMQQPGKVAWREG